MRLERMLGILMTLLNVDRTTAQDLADKYEVSVRTIYRDVESLSAAGFPVFMQPGKGGGIGILPSYTLPRSLLTQKEQGFLLQLLRDFSGQSDEAAQIEAKLSALFQKGDAPEWLHVDIRSWQGGEEDTRFDTCKRAIQSGQLLHFAYRDGRNAYSVRVVEPMTLVFRSGNWYLFAFCLQRGEYRLFRLSRMNHECALPGSFSRRDMRFQDWVAQTPKTPVQPIELLFSPAAESRVLDVFAASEIRSLASGDLFVRCHWPCDAWAVQALLSFGDSVTVFSPAHLRHALAESGERLHAKHIQDHTAIWKETMLMESQEAGTKEMTFCQSCSMPMMSPADHGREKDGSIQPDYCQYCYDGGFTNENITVDEMIEFCVPHVSNGNPYPNAETARAAMKEYFPQLKRWKEGV